MMASIFWLLFLVFFTTLSSGQKTCPSSLGWHPYRGKCYRFVQYPKLGYIEAVKVCEDDGATIVSVNDADEHKFIRDWLQKNYLRSDPWWTSGLTSKNNIVHWQGDGQDSSYTGAWKIPSSEYAVDDEKVVYKLTDDQFGWAIMDRYKKLGCICEISLQEVHRIAQERRDFDYGLNVVNPALAPRGPQFVLEPETTVILGSTTLFFFDCVAGGNPEPEYEWLKKGSNGMEPVVLGGRFTTTGGRLNIKNPVQGDKGTFQCKVFNDHGTILSRPATLSFGSLGNFSPVRGGTVSGPEYHGAQLECPIITGTPGISYQWYKNTAASFIRPNAQKHTFVSSIGKLFFSELTESDAGTYYCMATLVSMGQSKNYIGSSQTESRTSVGFPLVVQKSGGNEYDPDIQKDFIFVHPRVPQRGRTVKLECFAYGTGPLIYSWSRANGGFPEDRFEYRFDKRILVIKNVDISDEDVYKCDVRSTKTKNTDSAIVDLKIQAEPFFIYPLKNQHVDIGGSLTWHCEALGSPFPTYKWYKDGQELSRNTEGMTISSNTLYIDKLNPKQNGMYQCAASNEQGTTFSSGQLRVLEISPSFEKNPMTKLVNAAFAGNVTIRCNPIGAPKPDFTWSLNGNNLNLQPGVYQPGDHYRLLLDGDLVIYNINAGDQGRYTCSVVNAGGDASDYTELKIIEGAVFTEFPFDNNVEVNMTSVLDCQASYPPERDMIYEWKFNDHVINFEREPEYSLGSGNTEGYLYIGPTQFRHEGWYTCSIISSLDKQSHSCYLTVLGPPGEAVGVKIQEEPFDGMAETETKNVDLATTRWITWMDGNDHGDPSSHYFIQFRTEFDRQWRIHPDGNNVPSARTKHESYTDTRILRLTDLKAGAGMEFRVLSRNAFGIGTPTLPTATVQISGAKPSQKVKNVRGGGGSVGDLTITWDPMPKEDFNGPDFKYIVRWRPYDSGARSDSAQWRDEIISHEKACVNEYTIESGIIFICHYVKTVGADQFYRPYQAQIIGSNVHGDGPPSNVSVIMSAEELPLGTAENVYAKVYNATALMVTWKPVQNTRASMRGKLLGYKINYWRSDIDEESQALQNPIGLKPGQENLNQGLIIGLEPVTWYQFNVQSYNSAGNGPKSSTYLQQTLNKVPGLFPTEVHVYSIEGKGVRVNFRGVSTLQREEPLQGYKVQVWKDFENIRNAVEYDFGKYSTGVIRNLTSGIIYQLRVFGYSRAGQGKRSSPSVYFTVGGGEMRINTETTEITTGVSSVTPSLVATALMSLLTVIILQTRLHS